VPAITGIFNEIIDGELEIGSVDVALCGYGSQVPRVPGSSMLARVTQNVPVDASGEVSFEVEGNDVIAPAGTYYTITVKNSNGDIVQVNAYLFLAGTDYDLDDAQPFDPAQPPPILPPLIIPQLGIYPWASTIDFNGSKFTAWWTTLAGDTVYQIEAGTLSPGNLYTIITSQDGTGGHAVTWATNIHNATPVDSRANGTVIQTFVATDANTLYAIGAGTYNP
jgi:hypothetical protein